MPSFLPHEKGVLSGYLPVWCLGDTLMLRDYACSSMLPNG